MNIVFIDDDEDLNELLDMMFGQLKIIEHSYFASSAEKALDYLASTEIIPHIIFVDLKMPKMDGFEFIEKFEEDFSPKFPETRLYVVSSSTRAGDKKAALGYSSVKDYIEKPLTKKKLEEIHQNYFS